MIPVSASLATILRTLTRAHRAYAAISVPLITGPGTFDYTKVGAQIALNNLQTVRRVSYLSPGSDTLDFTFDGGFSGKYSPLGSGSFGRFFYPGALDNKIQLYLGLASSTGQEVIEPKGVYVMQTFKPETTADGLSTITVNALDNFILFNANVYAQLPPRLYGPQAAGGTTPASYFNSAYALNNPSGDLTTYVCDAVNWMTSSDQAPLWTSDYVAIQVYTSDIASGATPTTHSFTTNAVLGKVTFSAALPAGTVVSVDARPLAMAPELMIKHLVCDFASLNPTSLALDSSGILLPIMEIARDLAISNVLAEIIACTASRGIQWNCWFDEYGALRFSENATQGPPVKTLWDQRDILRISPEYTSRDVVNVVRAVSTASSGQPLTVISYDIRSISSLGQQPTYDMPYELTATIGGMDPGSAVAFMTGVTSAYLFQNSTPTIETEVEILSDPSLQVGDAVQVVAAASGISRPFYITQIADSPDPEGATQTLRLNDLKMNQDFMWGLGDYAGAPLPNNPNQIQAASGLISNVSIAGTQVVQSGQPVLDASLNPVVATWTGASLAFSIELSAPAVAGETRYIWRWFYVAEDAYSIATTFGVATGNGSSVGLTTQPTSPSTSYQLDLTGSLNGLTDTTTDPFDVRANVDSPRSRRYYWPILRCSDWVTNDGVTGYTADTVLSSSWTGGVGATGNVNVYGRLRVGLSDYFGNTSAYYTGAALYASGTPAATILGSASTVKYGVDFGIPFTSANLYAGIKRKQTPCYLGILVGSTSGVTQYKSIPFYLSI